MWALLAGRSTTFGPWLAGLVGVCASSLVACSFSWSAPGAAVVGEIDGAVAAVQKRASPAASSLGS